MTLRRRLAIGLAFMAAVIGVGGWAVVRTIASSQRQQLDSLITGSLPDVSRLVPVSGGQDTLSSAVFSPLYIGRIDRDGHRQTFARPGGPGADIPAVPSRATGTWVPSSTGTEADGTGQSSISADIVDVGSTGPGRSRWRAVLAEDHVSGARLLVAASQAAADSTDRRLTWAIVAIAVAGLGAFGLVGWWVVLFGLRPISDVADTARAIVSGERTKRVGIEDQRTEAGQLARLFNLMVDENDRIEMRLRRFISDASHELRTPIASIRGFAELYRRGALDSPELLDDAMRRIGGESARMADLIEDLLLLARLDEGRPLASEPVDIGGVLRDAVLDASASHPTRTILVRDSGPVNLLGDEFRLRQIVANLIQNALVHGGPDATVTVGARSDAGDCVIEVSDDGIGMTPEQVGHATDRFWRLDRARSRRGGGAGLGLAITDAIITAHGGELLIESEAGVGTTVTVRLRQRAVTDPAPDPT